MVDTIRKATHSGVWIIDKDADVKFSCYVMDNEDRVLSLRGAAKSIGLKGGGSNALVRTLSTQWIAPYLSDDLKDWLDKANRDDLPTYLNTRGGHFTPISASAFVDLCKAYVDASRDNVFTSEKQKETAQRMYTIMTAFAKVGLVAIIDEITGFQYDREKDSLQKILSAYISSELLPWTERFPKDFYTQMFRLKKWNLNGNKRPGYAGKLTNQLIYDRLPEGVLEELKTKTPKTEKGNRKHRYHQLLTHDTGVPHLDNQLQQTIAIMKASRNWDEFEKLFNRAMNIGSPEQTSLFED